MNNSNPMTIDRFQWHDWYAWYPIYVNNDEVRGIVWRETIERRLTIKKGKTRWEYNI